MALNLAIHKATITDDGGTITATQANINGIHDEDESTNVLEIATNNTFYLHYDLGAAYQLGQLRIYASIINTAYWLVQCSNNDADWTTESLATTGSYVYSNINDGYRYLRIRCDTTGRSAISLREFVIDADATLMKYQAGSSNVIGAADFTGSWGGMIGVGNYRMVLDTEHPATEDGYVIGFQGLHWYSTAARNRIRLYVLRSAGGGIWTVIQRVTNITGPGGAAHFYGPFILDPPMKFKTGDVLAASIKTAATEWSWVMRESVGGEFIYQRIADIDPSVGDSIDITDYTQESNKELKFNALSHTDLESGGVVYWNIPIPDRFLTGLPGDSTDPRVVNIDSNEGLNPEIDFYSVVSSLASGIGSGDTSLTLHDASKFPQAAAGADHGGKLLIGSEKMNYTYISGDTVNDLARGVDGTSPAAHSAWDIVKDITRWIEISVDNSIWKKPGDAGLPLSLGATIAVATSKTFYTRANVVFEYQDDKQIYSRIHVLWAI